MNAKSVEGGALDRAPVRSIDDRLTIYLKDKLGKVKDDLARYLELKMKEWLSERGGGGGGQNSYQMRSNIVMTMEEAETVREEDLRRNCGWFQYYETCFFFSYLVQGIPFKMKFNEKTQRYDIITSNWRKAIWIILHLSSVRIFWTDAMKTIHEIRHSHDTLLYFELMVVLGYFAFDYPFKYKWLFKIGKIREFIDELQSSPLIQIAAKKTFKRAFWYNTFYTWYFSTIFTFFLLHWNVYFWGLDNYYQTLKLAVEVYYGISQSYENEWWYPLVIFVAFFFITQHTGFSHCCDLLSITGILVMNHVAHDVDNAMKSGTLTDDEVYAMMLAQKRLTKKFNHAFGLLVCVYVTYCTPYYSLHSIDMFDVPGIINWLNTFTYVIVLGLGCKWAVDVIVRAKRRKRWLIANGRFLKLERRRMAFMLDDLTWEKYGLGMFFEVNSFVSGEIASLLITVAVIRIQM